jgi:hypothetical protein
VKITVSEKKFIVAVLEVIIAALLRSMNNADSTLEADDLSRLLRTARVVKRKFKS